MKNTLCFVTLLLCVSVNAQMIQNKAFVVENNFYFSKVENKFAEICFFSVRASALPEIDCRELPIGLLSISNNAVRYAIRDGEIVSASFIDGRRYQTGPVITAQNPFELKDINEEEIKEFTKTGAGNYHSIFHETIIDGGVIKQSVFKNDFEEMIFDFAVAKDGSLYCFLILRPGVGRATYMIEAWKLLNGDEKIIKWAKEPKDTDWSKLKTEAKLIASLPLSERMDEITAFSIDKKLIVFNPASGDFYQLKDAGIQQILTGLEKGKSYLDSTLVVDKDNEKIFLLPKSVLKEEQKSFREILEEYGKEISIPK